MCVSFSGSGVLLALPPALFIPEEFSCINHYDTTKTYEQNGKPQIQQLFDHNEAIFALDSQEWLPDVGESSRKTLRKFWGC